MMIPNAVDERSAWLAATTRRLRESMDSRRSRYVAWNAWYLYGASEWGSRYNKIKPKLSALAARLFAQRSARFTFPGGPIPDLHLLDIRLACLDRLRSLWTSSYADTVYAKGTLGSLIDGCSIAKFGWRNGSPTAERVRAGDFAVWRSDLDGLEGQQAMLHLFRIDRESAGTWLRELGMRPAERDLWLDHWDRGENAHDQSEGGLTIGAMNPINIDGIGATGNAGAVNDWGRVSAEYEADDSPTLEVAELWAWDDQAADWRIFQTIEGELVVSDRANDFLPHRHPFVHLCVDPTPSYFWGFSACSELIPLQAWREKRMNQLDKLFARQATPPMVVTGFNGNMSEKVAAIMRRGGAISSQTPGAKVTSLAPAPDELRFSEIAEIDSMFDETLGLSATAQGKVEHGVKGGGHAQALMQAGAEALGNRAMQVELAVGQGAQLIFELARRYDPSVFVDDNGKPFLTIDIPENSVIEVAAHSTSPLFAGAMQELAMELHGAGLADNAAAIDLADPPMAASLKARLKKSEAEKKQETEDAVKEIPVSDRASFFAQLFTGKRSHK